MSEKKQRNRWRCLAAGCNPKLNEESAAKHNAETGHRVAKWPQRSAEGKRRARIRNQTGYYDKYNVGEKSAYARGLTFGGGDYDDESFTLSGEDFSMESAGPSSD